MIQVPSQQAAEVNGGAQDAGVGSAVDPALTPTCPVAKPLPSF